MARVYKVSEPVISNMRTSRTWTADIDIGDGITVPMPIAAAIDEEAGYNDPVDLHDLKNGITLYGYILESSDGYALVQVTSMTQEGRYGMTPPRVFVKGGME